MNWLKEKHNIKTNIFHIIMFLPSQPELIFRYTDFVKSCLDDLDLKTLLKLAHLFDPSKPTLRPLLKSQRERYIPIFPPFAENYLIMLVFSCVFKVKDLFFFFSNA